MSYGNPVRVYANGYLVDSIVPVGSRLHLSGISMAARAAVKLAAKILTPTPHLSPPQVIKLIADGATPSADGKRRTLISDGPKPHFAIG